MTEIPSREVIFILLLHLLIACRIYGCGRENIEKEAISRGYATYNQQMEFIWKDGAE